MAVLGRFAWLPLLCLVAAGCRMGPAQWGPFRGQIVDAETGAPIPGAHVMVMWQRDNPNPVHWTQSFYDAQETVTDAEGRFEIPRQRRFFTLLVSAPKFDAFAPGYVAESSEVRPSGGQPYVDETVLKMRLQKTREERCKRRWGPLADVRSTLPNIMAAFDRYTNELKCWELVRG